MKRMTAATLLAASVSLVHVQAQGADITRHSNNSNFPIARAVEVPEEFTIIYHSGLTPSPADPKAKEGSPEYWGDTKTQSLAVFKRFEESFKTLGVGFGDVVKMTVFLVGDPKLGGKMDFKGFMEAYTQYYGTPAQSKLPARSTVQVAGLAQDGMLVEIEVVIAKPVAKK
jgi:enamine deaminase RidA (YjgF/YER057c/UK114 family)